MDKIKTSSYKHITVISDEDIDRNNHDLDENDDENAEIVSQIPYHRPKRHEKVVVVTIENDDDDDDEVEDDEDTTMPYSSSLPMSVSTTSMNHDNTQTNIRKYRNNFILFCIFFSINHATGSSCISLASIQFQQQQQQLQYINSHNNSDISATITTEYGGGIGDSNITSTTTSTSTTSTTSTTTTTRNHIASYQSSMVYISYTITALFGIPSYINNHYYYNYMNSKYGTVLGMYLFTSYVLCFWIAMILYPTTTNNNNHTNTTTFTSSIYNITNDMDDTIFHDSNTNTNHYDYITLFICHIFIYGGAILGGIGAAIAWTNQGIYYTQITNRITQQQQIQIQMNNNHNNSTHNKECNNISSTTTPTVTPRLSSSDTSNSFMIHNNHNNHSSNIIYIHQQNQQLLANIFAFCILSLETILYLITTLCIYYLHWNWHIIFAFYVFISFLSTIGVQILCYNGTEENNHHYEQCTSDHFTKNASPTNVDETNEMIIHHNRRQHKNNNSCSTKTLFSTIRLLIYNPKMKYMIGFNVAFALSSVYLNIFITGQVVPQSLPNSTTIDISLLITCHGVVAAMSAIFFGYISRQYNTYCCNNVTITILGSIAFIGIGIPFLFHPSIHDWSYYTILIFYALQGFGRSIFEGTWRAMYANYFPNDKDAAFANIVFLFGLTSAISYSIIDLFTCNPNNSNIPTDVYCVQYRDGTYHNIWTMIWILIGCSIIAIFSLLRTAYLHSLDIEISYDSSNILTTKNKLIKNGYAQICSNQLSSSDTPLSTSCKNVV